MRLRGRTPSVDRHDALRISCSNRQVAFVHAGEKGAVLLLKSVFVGVMFTRALT